MNKENDYSLNEITFGRGKGYLNAGLRWAISQNLMLEINFNLLACFFLVKSIDVHNCSMI